MSEGIATPFVPTREIANRLDALHQLWNRREFVHPDPLEFLYRYEDLRDREVAAFIASALAYGRVTQILRSVSAVLQGMGPSPSLFLQQTPLRSLERAFSTFKHRFTTGGNLVAMLRGIKGSMEQYGSLGACFTAHMDPSDDTILPALCAFVEEVTCHSGGKGGVLLASPSGASACKKLHLFLRWMVRRDEVDPGGWDGIPPSKLIVPLDVHMHRVGLALAMTRRSQADLRTALEITAAFRMIAPHDPVRYDFVLTRPGIWGDADAARFLSPHPSGRESEEVR
jgi:uncharacterized protein (TIGR02757 family)